MPAPLLRHVEEHPAALGGDRGERGLELLAAVAAERVEDVAREALGVDADEHVVADLSQHESEVVAAGERLAKGDRVEGAVLRRQAHGHDALDELLRPPPILDQVGDGDHPQPVLLAVRHEVRDAGHRPVLVHDLADDAGRDEPGEPREVDRRLGLAGTDEHAAVPRAQRKDVAGLDEIVRRRGGIDRDVDRVRAVGRRDAGRHALAGFDRDRERGAEVRLVPLRHLRQAELLAALGRSGRGRSGRARASP